MVQHQPPPTPPMFASCLVFPLPLGPLCKESSGTQTVMLNLSSTSPKTNSWGLMERREPQKHSRIRPGYKVKFVTVLVLKSKKTKKVIIGLCSSFSSSKTSRNISLLIFLIPSVANCQQRSETQNPAHEHSVRSQPWPRTLPFHIPSCLPSTLPPILSLPPIVCLPRFLMETTPRLVFRGRLTPDSRLCVARHTLIRRVCF